MKKLILLVALIMIQGEVTAQSPLAFAPWQVNASIESADAGDLLEFSVGLGRVVPLWTLLPQTSPDSKIHLMSVAAGTRLTGGTYDRIRLRATALDLLLQRQLMSGGFHLLDYNRMGVQELDARWIGLSVGPGIHVPFNQHALSIRIMGQAGLSSWKYGRWLLPNDSQALNTKSGVVVGAEVQSSIRIGQSLRIAASGLIDSMGSASSDRKHVKASFQYRAGSHWALSGGWSRQHVEMVTERTVNSTYVTLTYFPGLPVF